MHDCPICLMSFQLHDEVTNIECGHVFHCKCLEKWNRLEMTTKHFASCPYCKRDISKIYNKSSFSHPNILLCAKYVNAFFILIFPFYMSLLCPRRFSHDDFINILSFILLRSVARLLREEMILKNLMGKVSVAYSTMQIKEEYRRCLDAQIV